MRCPQQGGLAPHHHQVEGGHATRHPNHSKVSILQVRYHGHLVSVLVSRLYQWPESQYTPTPRSPPSSTTQPPPTPCPAPSLATVADCQVSGSRDLASQGK